jgi:hypothetical protein
MQFRVSLFLVSSLVLIPSASHAASLMLQWDPPVDGITLGYVVKGGTTSRVYPWHVNVGPLNTYRVDGLTAGVTYCFAVEAYSVTGAVSDVSAEVCGTPTADGGVLPAPSTPPSASPAPAPSPRPSPAPAPAPGPPATTPAPVPGAAPGNGNNPPTAPAPSPRGNPTDSAATPTSRAPVDGTIGSSAPQALGATVAGRMAQLAWQPPYDGLGASAYRVEVGRAPGTSEVMQATVAALRLTLEDLADGIYYVRVRAVRGAAMGEPSRELALAISNGVAGCTAPPAPPALLSASTQGAMVQLTWQPGTGDAATGYMLYVGSAVGRRDLMIIPLGAVTALNGTAGDGTYSLELVATNPCGASAPRAATVAVGASAASSATSAAATASVPGVPVGVAHRVAGSSVTIEWSAPGTGGAAARYIVEATTAGGAVALDVGASASLTYPNTPSGTYVIRVRAANAAGVGLASEPITIVVP